MGTKTLMTCKKEKHTTSYLGILTCFKSVVSRSRSLFKAGKTTIGAKPVFNTSPEVINVHIKYDFHDLNYPENRTVF